MDPDVFDPTLKKKKKKKAGFDEAMAAAGLEAPAPAAPAAAPAGAAPAAAAGAGDGGAAPTDAADPTAAGADAGDLTAMFGQKKKKKGSKKVGFDEEPDDTPAELKASDVGAEEVVFAEPASGVVVGPGGDLPWQGTDRDYKYEELLDRILGILAEHHPELSGERKRHVMRPPQIGREGTKKTVFANFVEICRTMHRTPDHVFQFLLAELGTQGSVDSSDRLILKGRFQQKGIETVLRRYIMEYVTCHSCKSPDTKLEKENRLYFLRCKSCGASRTVAAIKSGFQAQVGKRTATKQT